MRSIIIIVVDSVLCGHEKLLWWDRSLEYIQVEFKGLQFTAVNNLQTL